MLNKAVLWDISYGVYVVSTVYNGKMTGCIANCAVQATNNLMAVSINRSNYTNEAIKGSGKFAVSILSQKSNPDIISIFGFSSGREVNKFEKTDYKIINNLPVIADSKGYIFLKTVNTVELDTHTIFISEITDGDIFNNEPPMTYKFYHDTIKGRAPKAAPTYIPPSDLKCDDVKAAVSKVQTSGKKYRCKVCGYIYDGDITLEKPGFVCPVCKKPVSFFEEIAYA